MPITIASQSTLTASRAARPRRLRRTPALRALVRETRLSADDFVMPLFVRPGKGEKREISSMPGVYQWSLDRLPGEIESLAGLGIPAVMLFGIPAAKDPVGLENFSPGGIVQRAVGVVKDTAPEMVVMTDVCLCEYTDHGHCGLINEGLPLPEPHLPPGYVLNDQTLDVLGQVAVSHAAAGADLVAPSGMLDGMVAALRTALDDASFEHIGILSYAVKYASAFYGPFREAAESPPAFGDRRSHQMDPANAREALKEASLDVAEGADMLMVKPAMPYLDIIWGVRQAHPHLPLAAYQVSGEYAMLKAAARAGWLEEREAALESLLAIKRAGADMILTYFAPQAAHWLQSG